jgi:hypothetical protein
MTISGMKGAREKVGQERVKEVRYPAICKSTGEFRLARFQKYHSRKEAQKAHKQTGQNSSENAFVYPDFFLRLLHLFAPTVHFNLL